MLSQLLILSLVAAQIDPQALPRMVATERAFAAATAELGVRDGFLTFFAEDAISIVPRTGGAPATIEPARRSLESRAEPKLPLASRLIWEPFTGQISEDGTLGWLTGGYGNLSNTTKDLLGQGAYFSVWKQQSNGTWRVWLDEGISLPSLWRDATPFRVAPDPDAGSAGTASETLDRAEASVASGGDAWSARLAEALRLHRDGVMPIVGRDAVRAWATTTWTSIRYTMIRSEAAAS